MQSGMTAPYSSVHRRPQSQARWPLPVNAFHVFPFHSASTLKVKPAVIARPLGRRRCQPSSRGPATEEGRRKVAFNAMRDGLTSATSTTNPLSASRNSSILSHGIPTGRRD